MRSDAPTAGWHQLSAQTALVELDTSRDGLDSAEVARRRAQTGPNLLPPPPRTPAWKRFLLQFHNVLIYVLLLAGLITALLGHAVDSGVIFVVVIINALIGFIRDDPLARTGQIRRVGKAHAVRAFA